MIQFNLLPDIKLEYIKAKRLKTLIISISIVTASAALILAIVFGVYVKAIQAGQISKNNKKIDTNLKILQDTPDLDKILTVQNQLNALPELHGQKPAAKRLFNYLSQVTPTNVTVSKVQIDFQNPTMVIEGGADSLLAVNTFIDTLKFTDFNVKDVEGTNKAFSAVLLTRFDGTEANKSIYSISLNFEPKIFNNQQEVTLNVPEQVTTRSELSRPNALFEQAPKPKVIGQ